MFVCNYTFHISLKIVINEQNCNNSYIYIYIYTHTHTHTCSYTYIFTHYNWLLWNRLDCEMYYWYLFDYCIQILIVVEKIVLWLISSSQDICIVNSFPLIGELLYNIVNSQLLTIYVHTKEVSREIIDTHKLRIVNITEFTSALLLRI